MTHATNDDGDAVKHMKYKHRQYSSAQNKTAHLCCERCKAIMTV